MITAKVKYTPKKLTLDEKALKKAVKKVGMEVKNKVKPLVPKQSGAAKYSVDSKEGGKGANRFVVIGPKTQYMKIVRTKSGKEIQRIPNKYFKKLENQAHMLAKNSNNVGRLQEVLKQEKDLLKEGK